MSAFLFSSPPRFSSQSGIAIGVILFALAIIAVIVVAMSATGNFSGNTISIDRTSAEVKSQGNLIRTKIVECFRNGVEMANVECINNTYIPSQSAYSRQALCGTGKTVSDLTTLYPTSTGSGTLVSDLDCPSYGSGAQNLWTGQSAAMLPNPPTGFDPWVYVNAGDVGGRCIRIQPSTGNATNDALKQGLVEASNGFSDLERIYNHNSGSQRFIIWITRPSGAGDANCGS
jgi:hypothetical protein